MTNASPSARTRDHPFVLDEVIDSVSTCSCTARPTGAMDVVNIKISKFGGLTKAKQARDLCVSLGIAMTIEDSWGGDLATTAIAHLADSTPPEFLFTSTDFNSYVDLSLASDAPRRRNGRLTVPSGPGLGIHVDDESPGCAHPVAAVTRVYRGGGSEDEGVGLPSMVLGSISSTRVPSGSNRFTWRLRLMPVRISTGRA